MTHRFVILDRQSIEKLNQLGNIHGDSTIQPKDLSTPDAQKIIKAMPIVTTQSGYGLEGTLPAAKDWEKLRTFANSGNGQPARWARVMFDPKGHIKSITPAMDHVQCAKDLLRDPITTVDEIRRNLKAHVEQLPVAWGFSRVRGEHSVDVFVNFLAEVRRLESENPDLSADGVIDLMKMGPAVLYYETVNVLRMAELSKHGTQVQREKADEFLYTMVEDASAFIRMFDGKDPVTKEDALKVTPNLYNTTLVLFKITNEARQTLGYLPTLQMKLNSPHISRNP